MPGSRVFCIYLILTILLRTIMTPIYWILFLLHPCRISMRYGLISPSGYRFWNQCLEKEFAMITQSVNGRAGIGGEVLVSPERMPRLLKMWHGYHLLNTQNVPSIISLILVTHFEVEIFIVLTSQMKKLTQGVLLNPTYSACPVEFTYISVTRAGDQSRKHITRQNWNPVHKFLLNHSSSWSLYCPWEPLAIHI